MWRSDRLSVELWKTSGERINELPDIDILSSVCREKTR